jgi:two-component system, OmpR family, copper resistance phosphate regulon response regulator CusR
MSGLYANETMRLLVAEDEEAISDFLVRGLSENGYAVDLAADGVTALDLALSVDFDLILLDILLPGMDGLTVCRTLRQRQVKTPILMLTALDAVDHRVQGLDSGADDYLVKPFAFAELLARIRALSRREPGLAYPVIEIEDLVVDPTSRLVTRGGQTIDLTAKEYALLEYFMRNPGRVLTREMITDRLWSFDSASFTNVIDVYVGRLRRKLDDGRDVKLIQTVRGVGYKIEATPA